MADVSDVETGLVNQVIAIVYPNGTNQPSVVNRTVSIYRGKRPAQKLADDLANGIINISVGAMPGMYRPVKSYMRTWEQLPIPIPLLKATVLNNTITISGTIELPQTVMTLINGVGYPYVIQQNDTLDLIATGIAAVVPNATAVGPVVTIANNPFGLITRIGGYGTESVETKRQEQVFGITVQSTTDNNGYLIRDKICSIIDEQLSFLALLNLPDGTKGNISCRNDSYSDYSQKAKLLERTLQYCVQYATTVTDQAPIITNTVQTVAITYAT